jgi:hypothetical protein
MMMEDRATECGSRSEGKMSRNELTSRSVHSICTVPSLLEVGRDGTHKIYEDGIVEF